ncbi:MAG TPA: YciI family protein [Longimicrobiales bacterium]|nr:YciI family protein [Longimicrobiales bacterium]
MGTTVSSYLLLVRDTTPEVYATMTPAETRQCLDRWNAWVDEMAATGKLRDGQPLGEKARLVSGKRGEKITDGPFAEAKELVGGYFLLEGVTLDDATAMAQRCPLLPHGMTVEVRPVAAVCHLATSLGWETMRGPAGPG